LTADEIRALFFGHRLHGRTVWTSSEHAASITPDGVVTASGDWGTMNEGIAEFEGDRLCFKQSSSSMPWQCIIILRIPGGTKAKENEYLWISGGREFIPGGTKAKENEYLWISGGREFTFSQVE